MEQYELPLVFFTVFAQWGAGGVLALTLCQVFSAQKFSAGASVLDHYRAGVLCVAGASGSA